MSSKSAVKGFLKHCHSNGIRVKVYAKEGGVFEGEITVILDFVFHLSNGELGICLGYSDVLGIGKGKSDELKWADIHSILNQDELAHIKESRAFNIEALKRLFRDQKGVRDKWKANSNKAIFEPCIQCRAIAEKLGFEV